MTNSTEVPPGLTGLNLYNQNGGVAQGQICGQGIVTKLLRNKKSGGKGPSPLSQNAIVFNKDSSMCMSPMSAAGGGGSGSVGGLVSGKHSKKLTKYKSNLYENMNQSSIDTESCSSDDIFSETTSTASSSFNATIDDLQAPVFVAQFDPMQLAPGSTEGTMHQGSPTMAGNGGPRKTTSSWSASLPAVAEEDSQSEQGSQQQQQAQSSVRRNWQGAIMQSPQEDEHPSGEENSMDWREQEKLVEKQPQGASSPPPQQSQRQRYTEKESRKSRKSKPSKQQLMREAMDKRIQQAMEEEQLRQNEVEKENESQPSVEDGTSYRKQKLDMYNAPFAIAGAGDQKSSDESTGTGCNSIDAFFDPFQHQSSDPMSASFATSTTIRSFLPDTVNRSSEPVVANTMQDLLLQQQMTLKEMSLQNYHYRRELTECQEIFGKWKLEREKQQTIINGLVQEKKAYENEARFLRNEMSSIRAELEALRKETKLQAEHQSKQNKQQQRQLSPCRPERSMNSNSLIGGSSPPPPPLPRTRVNCRDHHRESPKPLPSVFKAKTPTETVSSSRQQTPDSSIKRSVKFHEPPKSKEWMLFPDNMHDNCLDNGIADGPYSNNESYYSGEVRVESRQQEQPEREGPGAEHVRFQDPVTPTTSPTVKSARISENNGVWNPDRRAYQYAQQKQLHSKNNQNELANAYKYRLETIQKNRQERFGNKEAPVSGGGEGFVKDDSESRSNRVSRNLTPGRRRRRSRPAAT